MAEAYTDENAVTTAAIPAELKSYLAWVVWRYEQRGGVPTKVPYVPGEGNRRASTTDLRTWRTFIEAVEAHAGGGFDGIGFVLSSGDPFAATDLDGCRDPETGEIEPWAQKIIAAAGEDSYTEVSPSGRGVHIIVRGKAPNRKRGPVECYSERRFFTVTGRAL